MKTKNRSLYAYIKYVTIKKRYDNNNKNKQWCKEHKLTPLHVMWLNLVK